METFHDKMYRSILVHYVLTVRLRPNLASKTSGSQTGYQTVVQRDTVQQNVPLNSHGTTNARTWIRIVGRVQPYQMRRYRVMRTRLSKYQGDVINADQIYLC